MEDGEVMHWGKKSRKVYYPIGAIEDEGHSKGYRLKFIEGNLGKGGVTAEDILKIRMKMRKKKSHNSKVKRCKCKK